jgi:hypothetical protein
MGANKEIDMIEDDIRKRAKHGIRANMFCSGFVRVPPVGSGFPSK